MSVKYGTIILVEFNVDPGAESWAGNPFVVESEEECGIRLHLLCVDGLGDVAMCVPATPFHRDSSQHRRHKYANYGCKFAEFGLQ